MESYDQKKIPFSIRSAVPPYFSNNPEKSFAENQHSLDSFFYLKSNQTKDTSIMDFRETGDINDKRNDIIVLFDVDDTITKPRQIIEPEMDRSLQELRKKVTVGLVGGSDLNKIASQTIPSNMRTNCNDPIDICANRYDYVFAENGLVAYRSGQLISKQSLLDHLGEDRIQKFINFCLAYMSTLILPSKRGNFIEFRNGLINVCPVGRSCNQEEREAFHLYDKEHKIRENFIKELEKKFGPHGDDYLGLEFLIGGQISFDVFPKGWDKTYCLDLLDKNFKEIHFFGDKTHPGGNDHAIFADPRTIGHTVQNPAHTLQLLHDIEF